MSTVYVWSGASGADDGTSWADAFTTLAAGVSDAADEDDRIFIHKTHSETLTANTIYTANTNHPNTNPLKIIVVDKDNSDTPVDDHNDMGANGVLCQTSPGRYIRWLNDFYVWGLRFRSTASSNVMFTGEQTFENCYFEMDGTGILTAGIAGSSWVRFINSEIDFSNTGNGYIISGGDGNRFSMYGGEINHGGSPTSLIVSNMEGSHYELNGVDLSGVTPTNWVDSINSSRVQLFEFINCLLPSDSLSMSNGSMYGNYIRFVNCSTDTDGRYFSQRKEYANTLKHSLAVYRDDGASYDGTNEYSFNVITSEISDSTPFRQLLAVLDPGSLDGKTLEIEITHDVAANSGNIQDDEMWLEMMAFDSSSGVHWETSRVKPTATPSNISSSSKTWTGEKTYTQKISHAWASGGTKGLLYVFLCVAKGFAGGSGSDVFVCPKVEVV